MEIIQADIHIPARSTPAPYGEHIDDGLGKWGRPTLALAIAERGMNVLFSRGPGAYDVAQNRVSVLVPEIKKTPDGYEVTVNPAEMAIESINVIRNVTKVLGNRLPELNDPVVRELARDKIATNNLLQTLDLAKSFAVVDPINGVTSALEAITGRYAVLKPRRGRTNKSITVADKNVIADKFLNGEIEASDEWVVEEKLDFTPSVNLRGINEQEQAKIDTANKQKAPKELRIYTFGRPHQTRLAMSSVLRVGTNNDNFLGDSSPDEWVYIDAESVPEEVMLQTDAIARAMENHTNVKEMHIAIDWAYSLRPGQTDPVWLPMEINGTEPQLVFENENPELAKEQAGMLSDQLYRVVVNGGTHNG